MSVDPVHPMMPRTTHDELSEQAFVHDLKAFVFGEIESQLQPRVASLKDADAMSGPALFKASMKD